MTSRQRLDLGVILLVFDRRGPASIAATRPIDIVEFGPSLSPFVSKAVIVAINSMVTGEVCAAQFTSAAG